MNELIRKTHSNFVPTLHYVGFGQEMLIVLCSKLCYETLSKLKEVVDKSNSKSFINPTKNTIDKVLFSMQTLKALRGTKWHHQFPSKTVMVLKKTNCLHNRIDTRRTKGIEKQTN